MKIEEAELELSGHLSIARKRLLEAHIPRVPDPLQGLRLLRRWLDTTDLPDEDDSFLHLLYLASSSEPLFLGLMRRPDSLGSLSSQVVKPGGLGKEGMEEELARIFLLDHSSPEGILAGFRVLQTARILIQDVLNMEPPETLMRELSFLADVLIDKAFTLTYQPLREQMGLPLRIGPDGKSIVCPLCVFSLGKLGGIELNYSSDVDFIAFYRSEGSTDQGVANRVFFNHWVKAATSLLTAPTPYGPCLKVDTDLRPRGRDGELTMSFEGALAYYSDFADLWERQAWIKARVSAGDPDAGAVFLGRMEKIIYRAYSPEGIADQIVSMRSKSTKKLARSGKDAMERNIKEGPGGIRDVEFAVQALQLAHGSDDRWVREGSTLLAMHKLEQKGYLPRKERLAMARSYLLLRQAEHWSQFRSMRQCHNLPADRDGWTSLSRFLGIFNISKTETALAQSRRSNSDIFNKIMDQLSSRGQTNEEVSLLLSPGGVIESLNRAGVKDTGRTGPILEKILRSMALQIDTPAKKRRFMRVYNSLKHEVATAPDPFHGLSGFSKILLSFSGDSDITPLLLERVRLARLLFRLISRSDHMTDRLMKSRHLLDCINYASIHNIDGELKSMEKRSFENDDIRRSFDKITFLISCREIITGESFSWAEEQLSLLADSVLSAIFVNTCREVEEKENLPSGSISRYLAVVSLGRLGLREMQPRSDLDLLMVKNANWIVPSDPELSARAEAEFMREFIGKLTAVTRHGGLYDIDLRLRPYGNSGPQVQSIAAYLKYFNGPARLWERTAYLKGRCVAGNLDLGSNLLNSIRKSVMKRSAEHIEVTELLELRKKMCDSSKNLEDLIKFREGGLLHLDILLLVLLIKSGLNIQIDGTANLITSLGKNGVLRDDETAFLYRARMFQDELLHRVRLHLDHPPSLKASGSSLDRLRRFWAVSAVDLDREPPGHDIKRVWDENSSNVAEIAGRYLI